MAEAERESDRRARFRLRVNFERQVILITNQAFPGGEMLAGLTRAAIGRWLAQRLQGDHSDLVRRVADRLRDLGAAAGLLADRSRTVFDPGAQPEFDGGALLGGFLTYLQQEGIRVDARDQSVDVNNDGVEPG